MGLRFQQPFLPGQSNEAGESCGFIAARAAPGTRDAIEARTPAAGLSGARRVDFLDQTGTFQAPEIAVQHRRPEPHLSGGLCEDIVHDAQSVQVAVGEREQDLKPVRRYRAVGLAHRCVYL